MSHPGRLEGKIALVTGGGMGLGEGIVRKFVHEGARVLVFEINRENGEKVASSLGEKAKCFTGDVTKEQDWSEALRVCKDVFGGLDVVCSPYSWVVNSFVGGSVLWETVPLNPRFDRSIDETAG